ncbi:MAG: L-amino acid N-acyltransferase [Alphaproteobacteria bacterium]|nr:L-amino acid N-acyltransferase [Alphaproteobacteria bacterium]
MLIRDATHADLPGILAIYNEVIATSTAVYAFEPVTLEDRAAWLEARQARQFPVLVAMEADEVLGFASYGDWRGAWAGYKYTVEHSVHIRDGLRGKGIGRQLMQQLINEARQAGLHVMIGGVDADNKASIKFHERLGFAPVAHFNEVGFKFGRWLDLVFMQLLLSYPK